MRKILIIFLFLSFIVVCNAQACTYDGSSDLWGNTQEWTINFNSGLFSSFNNGDSWGFAFNGSFNLNDLLSSWDWVNLDFGELGSYISNIFGDIDCKEIINFCKKHCSCECPCNVTPAPLPSSILLLLSAMPILFVFFSRKENLKV